MQRHNSFTSLHSLSSSRSSTTDYVRDSSTGALLDDTKFAKRSRKGSATSTKPTYNFPNGETFTPRTTPSKRNKPARMTPHTNRPLARTPSLVSVNSTSSASGTSPQSYTHIHMSPHLNHSHSFSNIKEKSKQSLMDSIRTNRLDTPTNIVLPVKTASTPQSSRRSYSLTNNKYCENSSNIIRNESSVSGSSMDNTSHLGLSTSDSNPSSISNYNCSGSNTPQTSVSGSEVASDMSRSEGSTESVSSYSNAKETSSLESIKESYTSDFPPAQESLQGPVILSSSSSPSSDTNKDTLKRSETDNEPNDATNVISNDSESTSVQIIPSSAARSSAKAGKQSSGSPSSSGSSYRSFSEADDIDNFSHKGNASEGDSPSLSEKQTQDEQEECKSMEPIGNHHEGDEESLGSSDKKGEHNSAISDANKSDSESDGSESENDSKNSRACSPEIDDKLVPEVPKTPQATERVAVVADHRQSTADLPEPTIMLDTPAHDTYLKVGLRVSENEKLLDELSNSQPQTPIESFSEASRLPETCAPPTPISKDSNPPTPVSKATAPPTPISKDSAPATPIEVISERESFHDHSLGDAGSAPCSNQVSESSKSKISKTMNSESAKSMISYSTEDSQISPPVAPSEAQPRKVPYRSMLLPEPEFTKNPDPLPQQNTTSQPALQNSPLPEESPEVPSPISKDSTLNQQIDSIITSPVDEISAKGNRNDTKNNDAVTDIDGSVSLDGSVYYSPVQIDKFFADKQEEVPPRGDLDVNNGFIKVHKRSNSSMGSASSMQIKAPPAAHKMPEIPRQSPLRKPYTPTAARYSMLAVVDVDYDKSLPDTPHNDKRASQMHHDFQNSLSFDIETASKASLTDTVASSPAVSPEKKSIMKKFSKFLSSGTKEKNRHRLNSKSSNSSMNAFGSKIDDNDSVNTKDTWSLRKTMVLKTKSSALEKGRKRGLFLNLKLGSSSHVDDLPSPVYSVREKQSQGETSVESTPTTPKFDLPNYEVEKDDFTDVLMKFDEVEKEVEKDIIKLRKGNSIHDFFAKDDELTNDQIVDQKRKDNHQSEESLLSKFSSANSSYESVQAAEAKPSPHDSYSGITEDIIAQMKTEDMASEFPPNDCERTVIVSRQQLQFAYNEPKGGRKSYLHYAKQFADFQEVEIKLKGFEPFRKTKRDFDDAKSNSGASEKPSVLRKDFSEMKSTSRSVKFSNSICISETYAPYMYKRNNKAVTQYYVNDLNEISKIKNELNAFKCYEMLVHEKSQTNTQFFY